MSVYQPPLDAKLDIRKGRIPAPVMDAVVYVNDTLELAWASAIQVFGETKATPQLALDIYELIQNEIAQRKKERL